MNYDLIIKPEAEKDMTNTFEWYERKRKGLGYDFLLQVDAGFRFITRNPLSLRKRYKATRQHIIKRFPYSILYIVEDTKVIVLGVVHGGRNPKLIKKKFNTAFLRF